jgi:hypothetical protein
VNKRAPQRIAVFEGLKHHLIVNIFMCNTSEFAFNRLLRHAKINTVQFDSIALIKIAQQSSLGRKRIELARPYLTAEYGHSVRQPNGQYQTLLHWEDVPASLVLDYIYGIDFVINFRGWCLGIDVTANPDVTYDKQGKLEGLKEMWSRIGIDHTAVFLVSIPSSRPALMEKTLLMQQLKQVLKGKQVLELAL